MDKENLKIRNTDGKIIPSFFVAPCRRVCLARHTQELCPAGGGQYYFKGEG